LTSITFIDRSVPILRASRQVPDDANLNFQLQQQRRTNTARSPLQHPRSAEHAITLDINGGIFTGSMNGNVFTITSRRHPAYLGLLGVPGYAGPHTRWPTDSKTIWLTSAWHSS